MELLVPINLVPLVGQNVDFIISLTETVIQISSMSQMHQRLIILTGKTNKNNNNKNPSQGL